MTGVAEFVVSPIAGELLTGPGKKTVGKQIAKQGAKLLTQKHHIIPKAIYKKYKNVLKPLLARDGAFNLRNLPTPFHGNHPQYNRYVGNQIEALIQGGNLNSNSIKQLHGHLNSMIDGALNSGMKLNDYFRQF